VCINEIFNKILVCFVSDFVLGKGQVRQYPPTMATVGARQRKKKLYGKGGNYGVTMMANKKVIIVKKNKNYSLDNLL
jgi:hypothetical protein